MNEVLLAWTPTIKSPMTVPYRYVLARIPVHGKPEFTKEFVVWTELFSDSEPRKHVAYHQGNYFPVRGNTDLAFANALERWTQKVNELQAYISADYDRCSVVTWG